MSQEDLAFAADVDRSYISEIELAKSSASVAILERIAHAMDLDIIDLLHGEIDHARPARHPPVCSADRSDQMLRDRPGDWPAVPMGRWCNAGCFA